MSLVIERDAETVDFVVRPIPGGFAGEIIGLDLRRPLSEPVRRAVYDAFVKHHVIAFRNQQLSKDEQIAFSIQFGTLERHIARNRGSDNPLVHMVTNLGTDGKPSGVVKSTTWHTDKSFRPEPSLATILHAVTMPPNGGDTCFANMYGAYDALSDADKALVNDLRVIHSWELSQAKSGKQATPEEIADAPPMSHPLARIHPDTGRRCLFMGEHASHIDGWPMEKGRELLARLEAHATAERFIYRHHWQPGDMLMWDNRCLLHRADSNFDAAMYPRILHRTCLRGTAPG